MQLIQNIDTKRIESFNPNTFEAPTIEFRKLSILIPVYNEQKTILTLLHRVSKIDLITGIQKELVIVNDSSTDETHLIISEFIHGHPEMNIKYYVHPTNKGKGAALHTCIRHSSGDLIIVQDADLEYDPRDYNTLLEPIIEGYADVVYGTRFYGGKPHRILFFWHSIGNAFLTFISNIFTGLNLTDMETCYKLFRADILKLLILKEERFGFEPEVTAKIARLKNVRIYEVGISYYGRTLEEGKKINWRDGFRALFFIIKYRFARPKQTSNTDIHGKQIETHIISKPWHIAK
jgi:glycosyltransferase involved in cell wall biosynthesis